MRLFATGVGGVLYPPHCMHTEVLNKEAVLSLCLRNDDVWLKMMQVLNNCPVIVVKPYIQLTCVANSKTQKIALCSSNVGLNKNDEWISNVLKKKRIDKNIIVTSLKNNIETYTILRHGMS